MLFSSDTEAMFKESRVCTSRLLNIYTACTDPRLENILQAVPPLDRFSHQFICRPEIDIESLKNCRIIIIDFDTVPPESFKNIFSAKDDNAVVIGCFTAEGFPASC